jgi:esterase/lipase
MKSILTVFLMVSAISAFSQVLPVNVAIYNNGNKLDARFWQADKQISPQTVILLHGFPGSVSSPYGLAEKLNKNGINVLLFNYEGSFDSEGVFTWENCLADIGAAISFLKDKKTIEQFAIDTSTITVCGTSLGASFALSAAVHNSEINRVIAVVGGNDLSVYLQNMKKDPAYRAAFEKRVAKSAASGVRGDAAYAHNYFEQIIPRYDYFDLIKNADTLAKRQIFFIAAWLDTLVPMEEFIIPTYRRLKKLNPDRVSITAFETDHSFTNARDDLANAITKWIKNK